jgi:hypothetical protein
MKAAPLIREVPLRRFNTTLGCCGLRDPWMLRVTRPLGVAGYAARAHPWMSHPVTSLLALVTSWRVAPHVLAAYT